MSKCHFLVLCYKLSVLNRLLTVLLFPVSTVANVDNNEIRKENNNISGHILLALFSIRLTLVSHYSAFSSFRGTDMNVLIRFKNIRISPANGEECRIM